MRLLVTGGLGFIGSCFIRKVLRADNAFTIVNLDAMTYAANLANVQDVQDDRRYQFVRGNICDPRDVAHALGPGVDAIVNFAAETHVDRSILDPVDFLRTDVLGTQVLLEAVRSGKAKRMVQVSTDEVYGHVAEGESTEDDPVRPRSPYSASKAGGDLQVLAYYETYGIPVLITRGSNTYGPYQYPEKLIPLFITNLIDDEQVPLYGDGMQVRDWLHVEDHAEGIFRVLLDGSAGHVYNVGGGNSRTNKEITERLVSECHRSMHTHVKFVTDRPGHDRRYSLDSTKLRQLGWRPTIDFELGLRATVEWYKSNVDYWRPIKSGEYRTYYERQYAKR